MTAQAWSTCSSVPWEQGDIMNSGRHDPAHAFPNPQKPQAVPGLIWASYPRHGSSTTRQEGSALPKAMGLSSFPTGSYVPSVTSPQVLTTGPGEPCGTDRVSSRTQEQPRLAPREAVRVLLALHWCGPPAGYSRGGCCSTCTTVKAETGARSSTACSWGEAWAADTSSVPSVQKNRLSNTARPSGSVWLRRTAGKEWRLLPSTRSVSMDWGQGKAW